MKAAKTLIMMSAALVMTLAVDPTPSMTARSRVAVGEVLLTDPAEQEHLVVHGEPERTANISIGASGIDRPLLHAEQPGDPAPLEHHDEHAERRPDAPAR